MESKKRCLNKKDITKLGFRSSFLQASFNFERMQAGGWLFAILPLLKKIYKDDKKSLSTAMKDHLEFINTNPNLAGFLMGIIISLEENNEDRDIIRGLKVSLFGPLAGIGDAIFWFTLLPIIVGISSSFALQGSILGPIIFVLSYIEIYLLRIPLTHLGYNLGVNGITKLQNNSKNFSKAATILGVTVIGGLVSSYVSINILSTIPIGNDTSISIQKDFFDKIIPNFLPLLYTFFIYYLLKVKQLKPVTLIFSTFIGVLLLSFLGIL